MKAGSGRDQEAVWKRLQAYGAKKMKEAGITSEEHLMDVLYEMRHGRKPAGKDRARADVGRPTLAITD